MAGVTKDRHQEVQTVAQQIVATHGVAALDGIDDVVARRAILRGFAHQLASQEDVTYETARRHIAQACRRLRHPQQSLAHAESSGWGGAREGAGRR